MSVTLSPRDCSTDSCSTSYSDQSTRVGSLLGRRRRGDTEHARQVARIGNNLNQIARWANTHASAFDAVEVIAHLVDIAWAFRVVARVGSKTGDARQVHRPRGRISQSGGRLPARRTRRGRAAARGRRRGGSSASASEVRGPGVHQAASAREQIRPRVGRLRLVAHCMRKRRFDHFTRRICLLRRPVPEA